jgi:hypothetical protein
MVLGMMLVFGISVATVLIATGAANRDTERENAHDVALTSAEGSIANGLSILANAPKPLDATALPSSASPQTDTIAGGTVSWYGSLSGDTWTITATSTVPNPAGGLAIKRTVSVRARVGSTAMNQAWNYIFSDASTCLSLTGSVIINEALYARGGLCTDNSVRVLGSPVRVEGNIQTNSSSTVGQSGTPIAELHVSGGCRNGTSGPFVFPCTATEHVYATSQDQVSGGVTKPPIDLAFWYAKAKPGPMQACTSGSFPGGFDGDTTMNRSRADVNLFASNYDCTVTIGGTQVGRIAYTSGNPGSLVIDGTVFFDGNIVMNGSQKVLVSGRGAIYSSGFISLAGSEQICGAWSGSCDFTTWDPGTTMLVWVAGTSTDAVGLSIGQSARIQGGFYAVTDYTQGNSSQVQGPRIANHVTLSGSSQAPLTPFTYLPPGAPMEQPKVTVGAWNN